MIPVVGKLLLDTNVAIKLLNGDRDTLRRFNSVEEVYVSVITLGELRYGVEKSTSRAANLSRLEKIAARFSLLSIDPATTEFYGAIKAALRRKGTPIPENDVWIAAIALQHGLTIATRDEHFLQVDGVSVARW